jgi:predicted ATPase
MKMHLKKILLDQKKFPTLEYYPFNLKIIQSLTQLEFPKPIVFFIGENGTGKSTLLKAVARRSGIHIWEQNERERFKFNPHENKLYQSISIVWSDGSVPGSFFGSETFNNYTQILDEWAAADPGVLNYFGGSSLLTQSHGQSLMSYFKSRYRLRGLYFLDEPETALSPRSQLELVNLLNDMAKAGHAQFVIASHSPILLACPETTIYSFDSIPIQKVRYEETDYYCVYKQFFENRTSFEDKSE